MKRYIFILLLSLVSSAAYSQTIIELNRGAKVRSKNADDYRRENGSEAKYRADSLQYTDNLRRAFSALSTDSLSEAAELFKTCLKLRPEAAGNHVIRYNLALIEVAQGQLAQAVKSLSAILDTHPDYHDARLSRAEANLQLGKASEAISDAESLMPLDTRYSTITEEISNRALFIKAAALYQLRRYPDAKANAEKLMRKCPENENAQVLEALCLCRMGQPKEALNRLNFIVAAHPDNVDALSTRAQMEYDQQLYTLARGDYDQLVKLQPEESNWLIERARSLIAHGEKAAARRDLDKAVAQGTPRGVVQALYNLTR